MVIARFDNILVEIVPLKHSSSLLFILSEERISLFPGA